MITLAVVVEAEVFVPLSHLLAGEVLLNLLSRLFLELLTR
jgi:hypothetical protein